MNKTTLVILGAILFTQDASASHGRRDNDHDLYERNQVRAHRHREEVRRYYLENPLPCAPNQNCENEDDREGWDEPVPQRDSHAHH
ncbi:MAG: hypothetical protein H0X51_09535 [Parachlamydiaceae bacterium]|nr:hypothetical protein [Parachlamydiaceae bacterium]